MPSSISWMRRFRVVIVRSPLFVRYYFPSVVAVVDRDGAMLIIVDLR